MKHVLIVSAFLVCAGAVVHFALGSESETTVTRVEQPYGNGPLVLISIVAKGDVAGTFEDLAMIVDEQMDNRPPFQKYVFDIGIPVVDQFGNQSIGTAVTLELPGPQLGAKHGAKGPELLNAAFVHQATRAGLQWGRAYCGEPVSPPTNRTGFCLSLYR